MMRRPVFACLFIAMLAGCSPRSQAEVSPLDALSQCAAREVSSAAGGDAQNIGNDLRLLMPSLLRAEEGEIPMRFALCALATDEAEATALITAIAEAGNSDAQFLLARNLRDGIGVPQDVAESVRIYRQAAEQGHVEAQFRLGHMLKFGNGVAVSEAEGVHWYRLAGENGHVLAQFFLGEMYAHQSRYRNPMEANRWYRMAAEQGHTGAHLAIAFRHQRGDGYPQNLILAHMWLNLARAQGNQMAGEFITSVESEMTRTEIAEAQAMATRCFNSGYRDCGW